MAKIAWHTDIVVGGHGMNVKVTKEGRGCAKLTLKPDVPGVKSGKAKERFLQVVKAQPASCSTADLKKVVEKAVKATKARWNKWHHEAYLNGRRENPGLQAGDEAPPL